MSVSIGDVKAGTGTELGNIDVKPAQVFQQEIQSATTLNGSGTKGIVLEQSRQEMRDNLIEAVQVVAVNDVRGEKVAKKAVELIQSEGISVEEALERVMPKRMKSNLNAEGMEKIAELMKSYSREELMKKYAQSGAQSEVMS